MKKLKNLVMLLLFIAILFCVPKMVEATYEDTFKTEDGIVVTKNIPGTNGDIELKISNIELDPEGSYTWTISRNSVDGEDDDYSANLGDYTPSSKTALISLTTSATKILSILRETNTAYLFIKDEKEDKYIVNALKIDLTLPALKAFKVTKTDIIKNQSNSAKNIRYVITKSGYEIDHDSSTYNSSAKSTYDIKTIYFKFVKITDNTVIAAYKQAIINNTDIETLTCFASLDDVPDTGWKTAGNDCGYYNTKILNDDVPTETGVYYLWLKGKDADSKTVIGYNIIEIDEDGPTVKSIQVTSPESGTYKTGQTVKIRVNFSEIITGTTVPTLKIKFGESSERSLTNGTIKDSYIEYSYNIQDSDKGQLSTVSLDGGTIKDASENSATLTCPIITGETIKANVEGTTTNNTENQDKTTTDKEDDNTNDDTTTTKIPTEAKTYGTNSYYIYPEKLTWSEAKAYCESVGGHLATITSKEEQEFIKKYIVESDYSNSRFWIGATDAEKEGTWKWVTGEVFNYSNWGKGEPDNTSEQDCLAIYNYKYTANSSAVIDIGQWDDVWNSEKYYFICEWGKDDVAVEEDTTAPTVEAIEVTSPESGTYKAGQAVKIKVKFSETIKVETVPTLKIKFGESSERTITSGTVKDNYIEYTYTIQESDNGTLTVVSLSGGIITDTSGNEAKLSCPKISGNTIIAKNKDTTTASGTIPKAGATSAIILIIAIVSVAGVVAYIKNRQLKGI